MADYTITKGLNLPIEGKPLPELGSFITSPLRHVYPSEYAAQRFKLLVSEGDSVKQGQALLRSKNLEGFQVLSPAAGKITSLQYGPRRALQRITIEVADSGSEEWPKFDTENLDRETALQHLLATGGLAFLTERPFSRIANPEHTPKSIFINAMDNAPFQADPCVVVNDDPNAFQAGLKVLQVLTDGQVHLCRPQTSSNEPIELNAPSGIQVHRFYGPYPAGNTSVHISKIDPIAPGDIVWTIRATDVALLGQLFTSGRYPESRIIALGGPGVTKGQARHYRVAIGCELNALLDSRLDENEPRIISGHALFGDQTALEEGLPLLKDSLTVIYEDREERLFSWLAPGFSIFSWSKAYLSSWIPGFQPKLSGTATWGSLRPMIVTGWYDRYQPLDLLTDFLLRAILAHDTQEAVELGILETDPEDFALATYIDPAKVDVPAIIRQGLDEIEKEGL